MRRLSQPSGQEMREAAGSRPRPWKWGGLDTFKLDFGGDSRGHTDGSDRRAGKERLSGHLQMPLPSGFVGNGKIIPLSRWIRHHQHSLSTLEGTAYKPLTQGRRGALGLCISNSGLAKLAMPVEIQGEPICSAQGDLAPGIWPLSPAVRKVPPLPARRQPFTELTALSATNLEKKRRF